MPIPGVVPGAARRSQMSAVVYHAPDDALFCRDADEVQAGFEAGVYQQVAEVSTDDLDVAYELTNTISGPWWLNEKVTKRFDGKGCRSTSVGDVICTGGYVWAVSPVGFTKLFQE